jgi:transcriptional regulator with XRE-family HTH domain
MQRELSIRLKEVREERNISIEHLANQVGISSNLLSMVEEGTKPAKFSYYIIGKIAEVLNVDIELLINTHERQLG